MSQWYRVQADFEAPNPGTWGGVILHLMREGVNLVTYSDSPTRLEVGFDLKLAVGKAPSEWHAELKKALNEPDVKVETRWWHDESPPDESFTDWDDESTDDEPDKSAENETGGEA